MEQDGVSKLKPIHDLVTIDLRKKENLKAANLIEIVTKTRSLIHDDLAIDDAIVTFCKSCLKCYVEATSYLQVNLLFNKKVIEYAQFSSPQKRNYQTE